MRLVKNCAFIIILTVLLPFLYTGCDDTSTLGFPVSEPKIQSVFLDTFNIKTSTLIVDSIATSGTDRILVGEYVDSNFGRVSSSSYLQLAPPNASLWTPTAIAVFDSMSLILKYDRYFSGDTTKTQQLVIRELSQNITARITLANFDDIQFSYFYTNGGLYNKSKTSSFPTTLGSINYTPKPISGNTVSVRLNDQKGKDWLEIAKQGDHSELQAENFITTFKGIKITNPISTNGAVVGFRTDSTKLRIYYSEPDLNGIPQNRHYDITVYNPALQYNELNTDRSGTPLQGITANNPVSSDLTNNETFIQGGTGVFTKIDFSSFQDLTIDQKKFYVLSARLVVYPNITVEPGIKLPANLSLYYVNKGNIPTSAVNQDFDLRNAQIAPLIQDIEFNKTTRYVFSVTQYVEALINRQANYTSILLATPRIEFMSSVNRMRVGNQKNKDSKIKLEIYLSRLNN